MILLIDNYDSFSYNLYQYLGEFDQDIKVIRNDELSIKEILNLNPDIIILSPGPGRPENAGIIVDLVRKLGNQKPILGICLGHQAIGYAYGANIDYAKQIMHGKQSNLIIKKENVLFKNISKENFLIGRYHSLTLNPDSIPPCLEVLAISDDNEIMAIKHRDNPVFGLQFHPESILTVNGKKILKNFLEYSENYNKNN